MGKTLLLTRPEEQAKSFAGLLHSNVSRDISCLISPLLKIEPTDAAPRLKNHQAVLFSSANGVRVMINHFGIFPRIPCFCVGDKTSAVAREFGCNAYSAKGNADDLIKLIDTVLTPADGRLLYVRGQKTIGDIGPRLQALGYDVEEIVAYDQIRETMTTEAASAMEGGRIDLIPLFSPMTAEYLMDEVSRNSQWATDHVDVICLSPKIARNIEQSRFRSVSSVETPTSAAMLSGISRLIRPN